jgi:hypothetical protein
MPNRLGYCGGADNRALLDYCIDGRSDPGLARIERQFQAAYPYLEFIAHQAGLPDAFDPRVVEAYWVGNSLLRWVDMRDFYRHIEERVGPKVDRRALALLLGQPPVGARPHHSFHVLDVSVRTGTLRQSLADLDACRISWGVVTRVEGDEVLVQRSPLAFAGDLLILGEPHEYRARYRVEGRGYLPVPDPGAAVSLHWGWVCDLLTPAQVARLEHATRHHLALARSFDTVAYPRRQEAPSRTG